MQEIAKDSRQNQQNDGTPPSTDSTPAANGTNNIDASGHLWLDAFGGAGGAVVYPQFAWKVGTKVGTFSGFSFLEAAPHEQLFTNNLVTFSPEAAKWFSVHTELGGAPRAGTSFYQIGPRVNITEAVPELKKPLDHLFVAVLPRFEGVRPNNMLIAGGTNPFPITKGIDATVEGYRRIFPHRPDYSEYWLLFHPKKTKDLAFGAFVLEDGSKTSLCYGLRYNIF
jgi:hypothetical protein